LTEGAACTVLLVKDLINNENPLIIANSDQYIEWDGFDFMKYNLNNNLDASILTFESIHPKWSFAKINSDGLVIEVAEKNPISNTATVGIYWYNQGADFVKYAEQMIAKNIRINNEFYVCPIFNEFILDNKQIGIYQIDEMWGIGTPEDLTYFLNNKKLKNVVLSHISKTNNSPRIALKTFRNLLKERNDFTGKVSVSLDYCPTEMFSV
jgi:dTDP-glucose pyrophosphorylase